MKKVLTLILALVLSFGCWTTTHAATEKVSQYEKILNEINEEYSLTIGYVEVDKDKVSLKEYEDMTRKLAKQQRELLDYIAESGKEIDSAKLSPEMSIMSATTVTKTKTKDVWNYSSYFNITATYDVTGTTISSMRNASLGYKFMAYATNTYITSLSSPTYSVIDGGRTGTVRYTGDLHYDIATYTNVTFYTEFYYSE